jgi:signal peptidase I
VRPELVEWAKTLVFSVVLFFGLRAAVVEAYVIPTGSMLPTIHEGDRVLGSKFHYWFWNPGRGDVVVFRPPEAAGRNGQERPPRYVKRVIAVGGDRVEVRGGQVFVNDERIHEPYVSVPARYGMGPVIVPERQLFVLGDNRNNSLDSHVWGFIGEDHLIARAFVRYWPPNRIGRI